jgi:mRNA interferase HigB
MRVIAKRTLVDFADRLAGRKDQKAVRAALAAWYDEARKANWRSSADVKRGYATASIVGSDRVVFNIKGNSYRLVVAIDYEKGIVWIKWIGTHADYDDIDVRTLEYGD